MEKDSSGNSTCELSFLVKNCICSEPCKPESHTQLYPQETEWEQKLCPRCSPSVQVSLEEQSQAGSVQGLLGLPTLLAALCPLCAPSDFVPCSKALPGPCDALALRAVRAGMFGAGLCLFSPPSHLYTGAALAALLVLAEIGKKHFKLWAWSLF